MAKGTPTLDVAQYLVGYQLLYQSFWDATLEKISANEIAQLNKKELHLYPEDDLEEVPEQLGQLSQLQALHLYGGGYTSLPESIGQLSLLQKLYLSEGQLSTLPESIGQLVQLKSLGISNNCLAFLPERNNFV